MMEANIDAHGILKLLARKHTKDVFVPECKTGSTYVGSPLRLDAWVMAKSWTNPRCTGYEIKCARSDFLRDEKWREYLEYCHCFYFVSPRKVIEPSELPDDVGLLWVSTTGTKLFTKKLAPYRKQDISDEIYRYVLMWRATVGGDSERGSEAFRWRRWLENKDQLRELGWMASKRINELIAEKITSVRGQNEAMKRQVAALTEVADLCKRLGLDPKRLAWNPGERVAKALAHQNGAGVVSATAELIRRLTEFQVELSKHAIPPAAGLWS